VNLVDFFGNPPLGPSHCWPLHLFFYQVTKFCQLKINKNLNGSAMIFIFFWQKN
jgi:hypothetical protein